MLSKFDQLKRFPNDLFYYLPKVESTPSSTETYIFCPRESWSE